MKSLAPFFALSAPLLASAVVACTQTKIVEQVDPSLADGGTTQDGGSGDGTTRVEGPSGTLFGGKATSFAKTNAEGKVVSVGIVVAIDAFDSAPKSHAFQDDLVLAMPDVAVEQTILHHLRANWLATGHGPDPYGEPHWDLHFLRGTVDEIDAIDCRADKTMPTADKIPAGYGTPELCVTAMGYHSWPKADTNGGAFGASIIMGYWKGNIVFLEPMIAKAKLDKHESFEVPIAKPQSAGGATTLYPTRMRATWDDAASTYTFEFDQLETID